MNSPTSRWHILRDREAVARYTADRILMAADQAISQRGEFRIVLAGGRTPKQVYRLLVTADTDWERWEVYFGDERCLPPEDSERNSLMANRVWLGRIPIPRENINSIPAEKGADIAARAYEAKIKEVLPFDLVLLGMGEDGHTASLFPGQEYSNSELVHAVHDAPKPPPDRVSLSARALSDAHQVLILVTGASKADAIRTWKRGGDLPVAAVRGHTGVDVLLDQDTTG